MKKLISTLFALSLIPTAVNPLISSAETEKNSNGTSLVMESESSNPDLNALASSLGADTAFFNFVNYIPESMSTEVLGVFAKNISENEIMLNKFERGTKAAKVGLCHGISILEILSHNGIISPSDIQEGAESLYDINHDESINDILCYYAMTQIYDAQDYAINFYFCQSDIAEQCKDLIEYGEKALIEKEYFYISYNMPSGNHAVVGIGAADGIWKYNDKIYDKCILTIDSNVIDTNTDKAAGFNEKACIYVNSETNEFYLPAYECSNENSNMLFICDNEALLNYKGLINPSKSPQNDTSSVLALEIDNFDASEYELTVFDGDDSSTFLGKPFQSLEELCPNNWVFFNNCYEYYLKGDSVQIKSLALYDEEDDGHMELHVRTDKYTQRIYAEGFFTAKFEKNRISLENNNSNKSDFYFILMLAEPEFNSPYYSYEICGDYNGLLSMEATYDGILLKTNSNFFGKLTAKGIKNNNGVLTYFGSGISKEINLLSSQDLLIKCSNESDDLLIFLDTDKDNVYEHEVQKGDVNCDGLIDASDASLVLSAYVAIQSGSEHYVNEDLSDYNSDGNIDASDASLILRYYSNIQTSNK